MYLFSLIIQPTNDELQAACTLDLKILCADDEALFCTILAISKVIEILVATGVTIGYHLEVYESKLWWLTVEPINLWRPKVTPRTAAFSFGCPSLSSRRNPMTSFRTVTGIKLIGASIVNDIYVYGFLRKRMAQPPRRRCGDG